MGNIVGDKFRKFVNDQINKRQEVHGKGLTFGEFKSEEEIIYLNSRNSWAKIASSVSVDQDRLDLLNNEGDNILSQNIAPGKFLAQKYILFNGFGGSEVLDTDMLPLSEFEDVSVQGGNPRAGVEETLNYPAYGMGNVKQFGFSAMPGIVSISQKCLNRGSLKKTTVKLKAFNKYQFDIIDVLYLRLGYTVFIEFGFDKYYDKNDNYTSGIEVPSLITDYWFDDSYNNSNYSEWNLLVEQTREKTGGNYEGIFGTISNFNWSFNDDGSYDIMFEVMSLGDVIESLKVNLPAIIGTNSSDQVNLTVGSQYITQRREEFSETQADEFSFYTTLYPELDSYLSSVINYANSWTPTSGSVGVQVLDTNPNKLLYALDTSTNQVSQATELDKHSGEIQEWRPQEISDAYEQVTLALAESQQNFSSKVTIAGTAGKTPAETKAILKKYRELLRKTNPILSVNDNIGKAIEYALNQYIKKGEKTRREKLIRDLANINSSNPSPLFVQKLLFLQSRNGIPRDDLKKYVFEYFKKENLAGGTSDLQFSDLEDFGVEFNDVKALLKGVQNRINYYFYMIRKYENRGEEFSYPNRNVIYSKQIKIDNWGLVGSCINPLKGGQVSDQEWNDTIGYPKYNTNNENVDIVALTQFSDKKSAFYIRFGTFLEYLQDQVIPKIKGNPDVPLITIDTDIETNICFTLDNMISLNPKKCIVRNLAFYFNPEGSGNNSNNYYKYFEGLNQFIGSTSGGEFLYGKIMNIYFNFNRIEEILKGIDNDGNISLFNVISTLCDDINECFGNFTNLEPVVKENIVDSNPDSLNIEDLLNNSPGKIKSGNTITILDQTYIPGIEKIKEELGEVYVYNEAQIDVFGFNQNQTTNSKEGSFVRKVGLQTQITKEYATMISIGATANGAIPGIESTAFSNWNKGLEDRFKTDLLDAPGNNTSLEAQNQAVISYYKTFMKSKLNVSGLSTSGNNLNFDVKDFSKNSRIFRDFYLYAQSKINKDNKGVNTSIGFLPFNLSLSLDGISGMHIYNKLSINQKFLPSNYPQTLQFIITGIDHEIKDNDWVTKLETLATVYDPNNLTTAQIHTPEIFNQDFTPVKPKPKPSPIPPTDPNAQSEEYKGIKWYRQGGLNNAWTTQSQNIKILIDAMDNEGILNKTTQIAILCVCAKESNFRKFDESSYKNTGIKRLSYLFTKRLSKYLKSQKIITQAEYNKLPKGGDNFSNRYSKALSSYVTTDQIDKIRKDDRLFYDIIYGYIANQNGYYKWNVKKYGPWGFTSEKCKQNAQKNPDLSIPQYYNGLIAKGDGYMYRGRGYNQITFKRTYAKYASITGVDILADPALLTDNLPESAKFTAKFFSSLYKKVKQGKNDPKTILGDSDTTAFESKERAIRWMASVNGGGNLKSLNDDAVKNSSKYINLFEVI